MAHDSHTHHEESFWRKYIFSVDHKVIGIQYGVTSLFFLLVGFCMMMMMRWQLAYPGEPMPLIGGLFSENLMPGGVMLPEFYNALGAMHGTIMIFLGVVPLGVGAFGNFVVPLQVGAPDMAFPKLNMASYWSYFAGAVIMMSSFFLPGGAAQSGWTSYPPLSVINPGQTVWLVAMVFIITSSLLGSVNTIVTAIQLRAKGLTFMRLPFMVWAQLVTAFLLVLAFPPLEAAAILQLMDRLTGTSFFMPTGLVIGGQPAPYTGGGSPILYQHLFWFLAHPEVYVLILPGFGVIAEVITNNVRKPLFSYKGIVSATVFLGVMSMVVWAHHMFMTDMGTKMTSFFLVTTMIISIPSVILLTVMVFTLWGGSIRINTPMLFALAFLPMFGIGGVTGLPLGLAPTDIPLHDTYYVIAHFHYVVAPGSIFALFAGVYYWYPKATGRAMNEFLGKLHFWPTLICMNGIFMPMFFQGLQGLNRRMYDGGVAYAHNADILYLNEVISIFAWLLGLSQIPFIINFFMSLKKGRVAQANHWESTTLEWVAASSPPIGHGNFAQAPVVYRGAYEYGAPGAKDYVPQNQA